MRRDELEVPRREGEKLGQAEVWQEHQLQHFPSHGEIHKEIKEDEGSCDSHYIIK